MKALYLLVGCIFSIPLLALGQSSKDWMVAADKADITDFDSVVYTVEHNYAGFSSKITDKNRSRYIYVRDSLRQRILDGGPAVTAMRAYVRLFNDQHLVINPWSSKEFDFTGYTEKYHPLFTAQNVNDSTFLMRVTSFDTPYVDTITHYVELYKQSDCPNLIIDIRHNPGGLDRTYKSLLCLIYGRKGVGDGVGYYSTPDNIAMLEKHEKEATNISLKRWLKKQRETLEKYPGEFVGDSIYTIEFDTIHTYPRKVGIITDRFVGSSAEQFIIEAKMICSRLTVYGHNTAGVLDYSNPGSFILPCGLTMRYPMSRSFRVPKGKGIDDTGIFPDVRVSLPIPHVLADDLDEWTLWVAKDLESKL